jgi:hypothetical protein
MCAQRESLKLLREAAHCLSAACITDLLKVPTVNHLPEPDPYLAELMRKIEGLK